MWLLFLDESGRIDQDSLFALGGTVVRDRDWRLLRDRWQQTLADYKWSSERELKWHWVRSGAVPPDLADAVFATLATAPFIAYA